MSSIIKLLIGIALISFTHVDGKQNTGSIYTWELDFYYRGVGAFNKIEFSNISGELIIEKELELNGISVMIGGDTYRFYLSESGRIKSMKEESKEIESGIAEFGKGNIEELFQLIFATYLLEENFEKDRGEFTITGKNLLLNTGLDIIKFKRQKDERIYFELNNRKGGYSVKEHSKNESGSRIIGTISTIGKNELSIECIYESFMVTSCCESIVGGILNLKKKN